jgi:PAX-interacting protein 1
MWCNGCAYIGEWKSDMIDGEGILFIPPKTFVHGMFKKNKLNGAAYIRTNEFVFEGCFIMG